jgi:hypothetical protein
MINRISSPLSVTATTIAFLWSIHKPTFVLIGFLLCFSLLPAALPHAPFADLPKMVANDSANLWDTPSIGRTLDREVLWLTASYC